MTNEQIVNAFLNGKSFNKSYKALGTNGYGLYSYNLKIAEHHADGIIVYDYTAGGGHCVSQTTSTHVGLVKRMAPSQITEVMRPDAAKVAGLV
tara:strand:- start:56 stop:334 length:279 start_codon:yes stop_codon:yes gene_type:complete